MTIKGITIKWPVWVVLLTLLGVGVYFIAPKILPKMGFSNETFKVGINPFSPFGAALWMNGGMSYNADSRMAKDFKLKAEFRQYDDRASAISSLISGDIDVVWTTIDIMSTETFENSDLANKGVSLVYFTDISRGADVVVVDRTIKTIQDFKGKKVIYTDASASLTVLLNLLESANMTLNDIIPMPVASGTKAAEMFNAREAPITVTWSPDYYDCLKAIEGSYIFFGTDKARNIVMDGFMVMKENLQDKVFRANLIKLTTAWLTANAEANQSDAVQDEMADVFAKAFAGFPKEAALDGIKKVRLCTYGDNRNLFGLNVSFKGVTGENLYSRMAKIYAKVPDGKGSVLALNPLSWGEISYDGIIKEITDLTGTMHAAEPDVVKFDPIKPDQAKVLAQASPVTAVKIVINFAVGSAMLDDQAKTILDREVMPYAKGFDGYAIRVEGNSDKSGNQTAKGKAYNKDLSYQRAKAVVDYLIRIGEFDANRFIEPIGWGAENPIYPNEANADESTANRRTEISFINRK